MCIFNILSVVEDFSLVIETQDVTKYFWLKMTALNPAHKSKRCLNIKGRKF